MPNICFSYSSDLPVGSANRGSAGQVPPGPHRMPGYPCFSYSADGPLRDLRRMPVGPCFSYSADGPLRDLRRMPVPCFSYQADLPPGVSKRNSAR
jgi:hypothetical protein